MDKKKKILYVFFKKNKSFYCLQQVKKYLKKKNELIH